MTARTDRSDLGRYSPAYATGREFGKNATRQILRRLDRSTGARTRSVADYSISANLSVVSDPLEALVYYINATISMDSDPLKPLTL